MGGMRALVVAVGSIFVGALASAGDRVVYEGEAGPGKGKHILFIASDHEYRGEETCPAIARIMANRLGFKCTVLFGQTPNGLIKPGSSYIPGIEDIDNADMLFLFLRFVHPEDAWMEKFEDYLKRGGPVLGLRTTTHAFNGLTGKYAYHNFNYRGADFVGGFGRQILGETWNPKLGAGHYGSNHKYATAMHVAPDQKNHPVLRGVKEMHAMAGAYSARPMPNSTILATNRVLESMEVGANPIEGKASQPAAWVRSYKFKGGSQGRAFCTTQGASEDILSEGVRRMIINATLWCMNMEDHITADADVSFVGPYNPTTFSFQPIIKDAKPSDIEGWATPILKPKSCGGRKHLWRRECNPQGMSSVAVKCISPSIWSRSRAFPGRPPVEVISQSARCCNSSLCFFEGSYARRETEFRDSRRCNLGQHQSTIVDGVPPVAPAHS